MLHALSSLFACAHAAAARFGADAAMFVHPGVLFAFLGAQSACRRADIQHSADHLFVRSGTPRRDPPGDVADVGAVQIKPDALGERFHVVLGQASVGTGRASLSAGIALFDAADQCVVGLATRVRVGADHFLSVHCALHVQARDRELRCQERRTCDARSEGAFQAHAATGAVEVNGRSDRTFLPDRALVHKTRRRQLSGHRRRSNQIGSLRSAARPASASARRSLPPG
jgi:hypothetical protein